MVLLALLTLQFSASNPSSTSGRGEVHPEQDVQDSWDTLNSAKIVSQDSAHQSQLALSTPCTSPRTLGLRRAARASADRSWGEVRTQEKPICSSQALPCTDMQIVSEKERLYRKMTGIFGKVVPPCPYLTSCPCA